MAWCNTIASTELELSNRKSQLIKVSLTAERSLSQQALLFSQEEKDQKNNNNYTTQSLSSDNHSIVLSQDSESLFINVYLWGVKLWWNRLVFPVIWTDIMSSIWIIDISDEKHIALVHMKYLGGTFYKHF